MVLLAYYEMCSTCDDYAVFFYLDLILRCQYLELFAVRTYFKWWQSWPFRRRFFFRMDIFWWIAGSYECDTCRSDAVQLGPYRRYIPKCLDHNTRPYQFCLIISSVLLWITDCIVSWRNFQIQDQVTVTRYVCPPKKKTKKKTKINEKTSVITLALSSGSSLVRVTESMARNTWEPW